MDDLYRVFRDQNPGPEIKWVDLLVVVYSSVFWTSCFPLPTVPSEQSVGTEVLRRKRYVFKRGLLIGNSFIEGVRIIEIVFWFLFEFKFGGSMQPLMLEGEKWGEREIFLCMHIRYLWTETQETSRMAARWWRAEQTAHAIPFCDFWIFKAFNFKKMVFQ